VAPGEQEVRPPKSLAFSLLIVTVLSEKPGFFSGRKKSPNQLTWSGLCPVYKAVGG
jgi:hypothetical protein